MNFINETMHPLAGSLSCAITASGNAYEHGDRDFYSRLERWRKGQGWSDEKTSDLYARVEEIEGGLEAPAYVSKLSLALWESDRVYPS